MSSKEYMAAYRKANRLRLREYDKTYRAAHPEAKKASDAKWAAKNKEYVKNWHAAYREKNRSILNAATVQWQKDNPQKIAARGVRYRAKNREREAVRKRLYRLENTEKVNALTAYHRAARLQATPKWANKFFMQEAYDLAKRRTILKSGGHAKWHVDHIVPLSSRIVCGLHTHNNLRVIPALHNHKKGNRHWPDMPIPVIGAARHVA